MMKGRPITGEEFDRLIMAVEKVRPQDAEQWRRILWGLWLSGLRSSEAVFLSWDLDAPFSIDLSGRQPAFLIRAEAQKSRKDERVPLPPTLRGGC